MWECSFMCFGSVRGWFPFWKQANALLTSLLRREVVLDPFMNLLGLLLKGLSKTVSALVSHTLNYMQMHDIFLWNSTATLSVADIHTRVRDVRTMENLSARLLDRLNKFTKIWSLWYESATHSSNDPSPGNDPPSPWATILDDSSSSLFFIFFQPLILSLCFFFPLLF